MKLELPYPPSQNRIWRYSGGRAYLTSEARAYKTQVGWLCRAAGVEPVAGNVALHIDVYRPRKVGDLDNTLKLVGDSIQGHLIVNDKQVIELHARRFDDKRRPRVEIEVVETKAR